MEEGETNCSNWFHQTEQCDWAESLLLELKRWVHLNDKKRHFLTYCTSAVVVWSHEVSAAIQNNEGKLSKIIIDIIIQCISAAHLFISSFKFKKNFQSSHVYKFRRGLEMKTRNVLQCIFLQFSIIYVNQPFKKHTHTHTAPGVNIVEAHEIK